MGAVLAPIGIFAVWANTLSATMILISVAIFFWMFWSISVHSLPGDYFPPRAVASVYGIAGTGSTVGSVISTWAVGKTLDATHSNSASSQRRNRRRASNNSSARVE